MSENEPNVFVKYFVKQRERGYWCPIAVDTPKVRCHGLNSITGDFEPCVDCPINWKLGVEK